MNEPNAGTEGGSNKPKERMTGISGKSHEAAERVENAVVERAERVAREAESARYQTAERFRRVASELRNVGDTLSPDDRTASMLAERASRGIDTVASYIASTDARGLVRDTERLARRQPVLFFGTAFALGLALGRFLKNEPPDRGEERWSASEPEWNEDAREQPRRSPPRPSPSPSQASERYRQNYDATFARDVPSAPAVAGSVSASAKPQPPGGEPSPESNGGRRGGRGKVS